MTEWGHFIWLMKDWLYLFQTVPTKKLENKIFDKLIYEKSFIGPF